MDSYHELALMIENGILFIKVSHEFILPTRIYSLMVESLLEQEVRVFQSVKEIYKDMNIHDILSLDTNPFIGRVGFPSFMAKGSIEFRHRLNGLVGNGYACYHRAMEGVLDRFYPGLTGYIELLMMENEQEINPLIGDYNNFQRDKFMVDMLGFIYGYGFNNHFPDGPGKTMGYQEFVQKYSSSNADTEHRLVDAVERSLTDSGFFLIDGGFHGESYLLIDGHVVRRTNQKDDYMWKVGRYEDVVYVDSNIYVNWDILKLTLEMLHEEQSSVRSLSGLSDRILDRDGFEETVKSIDFTFHVRRSALAAIPANGIVHLRYNSDSHQQAALLTEYDLAKSGDF